MKKPTKEAFAEEYAILKKIQWRQAGVPEERNIRNLHKANAMRYMTIEDIAEQIAISLLAIIQHGG